MKRAQLAVLGIALSAGVGAMVLMGGEKPAPEIVVQPAPAPSIASTDVLVAAVELPMGQTLRESDIRWQPWPADSVPAGLISRKDAPNALAEISGSIVRQQLLAGEPLRRERLIKNGEGGFMSAVLPPGMRAVAITIDTAGANSAGGFVLPNDRVDVIRTYRDEEASRAQGVDVHLSETILTNIRVLAIGKNVQKDANGNSYVDGGTATLELNQSQAESVTLAQKIGQLALSLRSLADAAQVADAEPETRRDTGLTVVRYGIPRQTPVK